MTIDNYDIVNIYCSTIEQYYCRVARAEVLVGCFKQMNWNPSYASQNIGISAAKTHKHSSPLRRHIWDIEISVFFVCIRARFWILRMVYIGSTPHPRFQSLITRMTTVITCSGDPDSQPKSTCHDCILGGVRSSKLCAYDTDEDDNDEEYMTIINSDDILNTIPRFTKSFRYQKWRYHIL